MDSAPVCLYQIFDMCQYKHLHWATENRESLIFFTFLSFITDVSDMQYGFINSICY